MVAEVTAPGSGPLVIDVSGAVASTVQVVVAGVASTLPLASVARTANVRRPSARPVSASGDPHGRYAPASRRHSKLAPASLAAKSIDVLGPVTGAGAVIVVSGAVVSGVTLVAPGVQPPGIALKIAMSSMNAALS